jgi:hypothetical protein
MFEWYFLQPRVTAPPPRSRVWTWQTPEDGVSYSDFLSLPIGAIKAFYQANLRFNTEVEGRGSQIAQKYNVDFSKTIGVTWRGTDCVTDGRPYMPIETYFPFLDDILEGEPDLRIAATAEEQGILDALLKQKPVAWMLYTRTELGSKLWCALEKEADARAYSELYRDDAKPRVVAVYAAPPPDAEAVRLVLDYYGGYPMGRLGERAKTFLLRIGALTSEGTLTDVGRAYLKDKPA